MMTAYEVGVRLVGSEMCIFFFQAEDGIRDRSPSRGLGRFWRGTSVFLRSRLDESCAAVLSPWKTFCLFGRCWFQYAVLCERNIFFRSAYWTVPRLDLPMQGYFQSEIWIKRKKPAAYAAGNIFALWFNRWICRKSWGLCRLQQLLRKRPPNPFWGRNGDRKPF